MPFSAPGILEVNAIVPLAVGNVKVLLAVGFPDTNFVQAVPVPYKYRYP
jgi:hypothetical protein